MIQGVDRIAFKPHGDERGKLVAIENQKDIPFDIQRVYYIYDADTDVVRGKHAHKDLNQVLLCLHGSCDILIDNGIEREIVHLNKPEEGIYIHGYVWREMMNFSPDCFLVLSDFFQFFYKLFKFPVDFLSFPKFFLAVEQTDKPYCQAGYCTKYKIGKRKKHIRVQKFHHVSDC